MRSLYQAYSEKVFIIGEAGVNHNGDMTLAKKLIDVAKESGADAVKFQTWKEGECTGKFTKKVKYLDTDSSETRYDISRKLRLEYDQFIELDRYCKQVGILFLTTPDGYQSLDFVVDQLKVPFIKISSTELTHIQFLAEVGKKKLPAILSTGMGNIGEVEKAYYTLIENGAPEVCILQCTSEYPAPDSEINVSVLKTFSQAISPHVGFSDHSVGSEAALMSLAYGARVIEKHFTLDKAMPGPDHKASMNPDEFKNFIVSIRRAEKMIGNGKKRATRHEVENMPNIRRGVVAARPIKAGETLTEAHLTFKRPFAGIAPAQVENLIGMKVNRDLSDDEPLTWDLFK